MSEFITISYNGKRKEIEIPSDSSELKNSFLSAFNLPETECTFKYKNEDDDMINLGDEETDSEFIEKITDIKKIKAIIIAELSQPLDEISDNDSKLKLSIGSEMRSGLVFKPNGTSEQQKMEELENTIKKLKEENMKLTKYKNETQEKNKKLIEERNEYKEKVEQSKINLERYKKEISKMKSNNPNNKQNNEDYEIKLEQINEQAKTIELKEKEIKEKNQQIKDLNKKLNENTKDLEDKQKTIEESKVKLSLYEEKIKTYENDINEYKSQLEQSKIEIKNLKQNKEQMEKDKNNENILKPKFDEEINTDKENAEKFMNEQLESFKKNIENKYKTKYEEKEKEMEERMSQMSMMINQSKMPNFKGPDYEHKNIKCEKCLTQPIIGVRYKCSQCDNYNLCEKCEEENNEQSFHDEEHNFIKIRKPIDDSKEPEEKIYSFDCQNILLLNEYIYEGTEHCEINIILKNNGNVKWPKKKTKLIFDESSQNKEGDIILEPQKVGEEKGYKVKFENLGNLKVGEYKSYLLFNVNGKNYGEKLTLSINVKEKKEIEEIEKYRDKIKEFREQFNLDKEEYNDEKLFEILKQHNFNFEDSFSSLFNN